MVFANNILHGSCVIHVYIGILAVFIPQTPHTLDLARIPKSGSSRMFWEGAQQACALPLPQTSMERVLDLRTDFGRRIVVMLSSYHSLHEGRMSFWVYKTYSADSQKVGTWL